MPEIGPLSCEHSAKRKINKMAILFLLSLESIITIITSRALFLLKGVSGEMNWGSRVYSIDRQWYGIVALDTLCVNNHAAILNAMYFHFRQLHVKK